MFEQWPVNMLVDKAPVKCEIQSCIGNVYIAQYALQHSMWDFTMGKKASMNISGHMDTEEWTTFLFCNVNTFLYM